MAITLTDRLSFWIAAAVVLTGGAALFAIGFQFAALLFVLHVPAVLAYLLIVRAVWLGLQRKPWALQLGGRAVGKGAAGIAVPFLFVLLWGVAREGGFVDAQISYKQSGHETGSHWSNWEMRVPERVIPDPGLAVTAPAGAFGDGFRRALLHQWIAADGAQLHGTVAFDCEPRFAPWPLWKAAEFESKAAIELQMRRTGVEEARCMTITMTLRGSWTAVGLMSHRNFQEWVGREIGEKVHRVIAGRVKDLHNPKK